MPKVCPILMPRAWPSPSATNKPGDARDQRQQVILATRGSGHSFKELSSIENADAVEEHDQPGEADRSGNLRLRSECANREADEKDSPDPKRKPADTDLADEVAETNGEKRREDRLVANDFAGDIQHGKIL